MTATRGPKWRCTQQAGAPSGWPAGPANPAGASPRRKIPGGFGEQSPLIPLFNTKENRESRARFFGGSTNESSKIATDNYLDGLLAGFGRRCV